MAKHKVAERQIARILILLAQEPLPGAEICARLHMSQTSVDRFLKRLLDEKPRRLHIAAWGEGKANKPMRIYKAGPGRDVAYVPRHKRRPRSWIHEQGDRRRAEVLELLAMPQTSSQLAARLKVCITQATRYLAEHRKAGRVHIKAWLRAPAQGSQAPVYALGKAPDKPRARRSRRLAPIVPPRALWAPLMHSMTGSPP